MATENRGGGGGGGARVLCLTDQNRSAAFNSGRVKGEETCQHWTSRQPHMTRKGNFSSLALFLFLPPPPGHLAPAGSGRADRETGRRWHSMVAVAETSLLYPLSSEPPEKKQLQLHRLPWLFSAPLLRSPSAPETLEAYAAQWIRRRLNRGAQVRDKGGDKSLENHRPPTLCQGKPLMTHLPRSRKCMHARARSSPTPAFFALSLSLLSLPRRWACGADGACETPSHAVPRHLFPLFQPSA